MKQKLKKKKQQTGTGGNFNQPFIRQNNEQITQSLKQMTRS